MTSDEKIKRIPVKFKEPPTGAHLEIIDNRFDKDDCDHTFIPGTIQPVTYYIRLGETEVECSHCGTKLDPMFVLRGLANKESQWHRKREIYMEEMKRLKERQRTKCECCGKMTRISRL